MWNMKRWEPRTQTLRGDPGMAFACLSPFPGCTCCLGDTGFSTFSKCQSQRLYQGRMQGRGCTGWLEKGLERGREGEVPGNRRT